MRTAALACALVGGAALLVGLAMPANAQVATPSAHHTYVPQHSNGHHAYIGGLHHGGFNQDGGNWSGFVATGSGFSSASVSWTEPQVSCNSSNDLMAPWVGIDGYGSNSVEQTGVQTDCSSGSPVDSAWYEMYPASPVYYNDPVSPGDQINSSVTTDGNGNYTLVLSDTTQGWTETTPASYQGANASAEAIIESPTAAYPNFGSVNFSGFTINGSDAGQFNPTALDASNSSGFEDHTSALSGGSFSIAYQQE
ncbi:MAG TPA: G1 family glutamic endopeptidase [Pseudonocardiaceae bacterium]